jgi:[Skp1-protein]-hydroxyproline N-acetylglucosaminyltransferase
MRRRRGLDEDGGGGVRDHTGSTTSRNGIKGTTKVVLPRSRKQWISIINCVGVLLSILYVILALASTTFLGRHNPRYWMEHLRRPRQHNADVHAIRRLQHQFPVHTGVSSGDEDWETIPHPGFAMADPERLQVILADLPLTNDNEESLQERTQKLRNLKVPKFWNPKEFSPDGGVRNYLGQGGTYVLSKEEAESIGSFYTDPYPPTTNHHATTTDDSDNDDGGEEEDRNRHRPHHKGTMETIFVALASYRDPECLPTLQDLYQRAKYPERIRVGIVDQRVPSDGDDTVVQMNKVPAPRDENNNKQDETVDPSCTPPCTTDPNHFLCHYNHLIDVMDVSAPLMVGPTFARHLAYRMYRGEYFVLQVDSHVRFVQDWDERVIQQWKATRNEMAVLTTYLADVTHSIDPVTHAASVRDNSFPVMCRIEYEWLGSAMAHIKNGIQPHYRPHPPKQQLASPVTSDTNSTSTTATTAMLPPLLQPFWAAGFSFARGHFVVQVPYDPYLPLVFQGEEISMTIRGFTYGYDFYAPLQHVAFHMYAVRDNAKARNQVKTFTENEVLFPGAKQKAYLRLNAIIGIDTGPPNQDTTTGSKSAVLLRGGGSSSGSSKDSFYNVLADDYGVGTVRSRDKFFTTFGIHTTTRHIEPGLCDLVQGIHGHPLSLHDMLTPYLRHDGMGIDYRGVKLAYRKIAPPPEAPVSKEELGRLRELLKQNHAGAP